MSLRAYRVYTLGYLVSDAESLHRVLHCVALRAYQCVVTRVWARGYDIVVQLNNLAVLGADKCCGLVTILEVVELLAVCRLVNIGTHNSLCVHRHQGLEAVATVNVQHQAQRAKSVSRVGITSELAEVVYTPGAVGAAHRVVEVVDIATLGVQNFTEDTLLSHIQRCKLEEVVDAVLEHHAVFASALRGIDELPQLLQGEGCGHLYNHVLAALHCVE